MELMPRAGDAASASGIETDLEKVTDIEAILAYDAMSTPALVN